MQLQKKLQTANQDRRVLLQLLKGKSADFSDEPIKSGSKQIPIKPAQRGASMKLTDNYIAPVAVSTLSD